MPIQDRREHQETIQSADLIMADDLMLGVNRTNHNIIITLRIDMGLGMYVEADPVRARQVAETLNQLADRVEAGDFDDES